MRFVASAFACVSLLLATAGCDPLTDRSYFSKGVGTEVYSGDVASTTELQNLYVEHICRQADLQPVRLNGTVTCGDRPFDPATWWLFVQAGMNDIDQRCDAYLTWLDNVRRSEAPVLKQITDTGTATALIMQTTGVGAGPIAIVAAAFGLASNTFTNITSRLILEVNHSTVQSVVLTRQAKYRQELIGDAKTKPQVVIASKPAAIYALRSYLRLCMPITIESEINNTVTVFERSGGAALDNKQPMISARTAGVATRPTVIRDVNVPMKRVAVPVTPSNGTRLGPFEIRMSQKDMKTAVDILGCTGPDLGPAGSATRKALAKFLTDNGKPSSDRVTNDVFFTLRELKADGKQGTCSG